MVAERFPDLNQDYYGLLGLSPTASLTDIRQAYRELSKQYHPDTTLLAPDEATRKFQQLQEAYATLSNPEQRRHYDLWRTYLAKRAAVALAEAELKGGPIAWSVYRRDLERPETDRPDSDRPNPDRPSVNRTTATPSPANPDGGPVPGEEATGARDGDATDGATMAAETHPGDRPLDDFYSSSAYLDAIDRPLSAGEVFALFLLGITFVGCIVLAVALGLARGEWVLGEGL